ncbi:MAG: VCBS repeat-containing protein [Phycisphaerales bacterium]|nr:VCBS repeat-containing protein [Phycisphaerales bacterium]
MASSAPRRSSPVTPALVALFTIGGSVAGAEPPVPFATDAWGADTGFYLGDGSAWWPEEMVTGDFDEDGRLDVAIANWGNFVSTAPRVSVLLAEASGRWSAPAHLVTPAPTSGLAAADLDGDEHLDLIVADCGTWWTETTVTVLRGAGDGTFLPAASYDVGAEGPTDVAIADIDGDGILDAVTANHGSGANSVSILAGNGSGGFGPAIVIPAVESARSLAVADADGDGDLDIAVAGGSVLIQQTRIALLRNGGEGTFGSPEMLPTLSTSALYRPAIAFADMDADGRVDIVYSDSGLHTGGLSSPYGVAVFANDGDGAYPVVDIHAIGPYTGGYTSLEIADLDGDGRLDIAGTHDANESWSILYGQADGSLGELSFLSAGEYPTDVLARDLDGDGVLEMMVLAHFSQTIMVHHRPAADRFRPARNADLVFGGHYHFDTGDIDGDGDGDLAASSGYAGSGSISVMFNQDGAGVFGPFPITYAAPAYASSVKLRDLDGDGMVDLLWADKSPPYSFRWRVNDGTGTFGTTQSSPDVFTCGVTLDDAVNAWDLDADGDLDVVLMENLSCGIGPKRLFVSENDGNGNFQLRTVVETYLAPYEVMSGDIDEDGHLDLVIVSNTIEVFLGGGDLTFGDGLRHGGLGARNGAVRDLDGDGHLDVVVTVTPQGDTRESIGILRGYGDGSFGHIELHAATCSPNLAVQTSVTTGDVDGDGDADVLLGNYASNSTSLFLNRGDATFDPQVHTGAMDNVRHVAFADVTGDGTPDALAMARFSTAGELGRDGIAIMPGTGGTVALPGDIDGDGMVGLTDLLAVLSAWGVCEGCRADLDVDGLVGLSDLLVVLSNWG